MTSAIPWVLSCWTLVTMWLAGNGTRWAWVSGLASQFLWLTFAWMIEAWGLMPLSVALIFVYARNYRRAALESVAEEGE